jgi:hypothetical protein
MLLAFVMLEPAREQGTEAEGPGWRVRYTAGVEFLAGKLAAAQPLQWRGDGVTLFFKGDGRKSAVARALEAAEALRERSIVDLAMRVRLAVHAAVVPWNPDTSALAHPAIDLCEHLTHTAPVNGIAVTEDVYLALPEAEQRRFALLGVIAREGAAAYVFPAGLTASKAPEAFAPGEDLGLWEAFRRYVGSPEVRRLRYVGFPLQKKQPPSLDIREVFIAPEARVRTRSGPSMSALSEWLGSSGLPETLLAASRSLKELEPALLSVPLPKLVGERRSLVVLGDPGSGKTTVLRWLAVLAAGGPLSWAEHLGPAERLLPLLVSVGRLAEIRERLGSVGSVVDALAVYFHDRNVGGEAPLRHFLERVLEAGECLVLLDGLDEVRSEARAPLLRWLETFCARFPRNRFIASARVVGYSGFSLPDGLETTLGPFDDEQVRRYAWAFERACRRWENDGVPDDLGAERESGKLLEALFKNPRLRDLARNPFLLSALALIHRAEGQLPRHRVQAYEIFSRTLCETWSNARRVVAGESETRSIRYEEEAIPILGELALRMHEEWPAGAAPEAFVIETLAEAIQARDGGARRDAERSAREFLERAGKEVQILLERGAGQWGFLHLTFQEFFTAVGLLSSERFEEVAFEHLLDPRWEEVLRLGVGYMALIQKRAQATQKLIRRVLEYQEQGERRYVTELLRKQIYLASLLASEAGDVLPVPLQQEIARALVEWIRDMPLGAFDPFLRELALTDFSERLLDVLLRMTESADEHFRSKAMKALGFMEGPPRARRALLEFTQAPSSLLRVGLCRMLADLDAALGKELLTRLVRDPDLTVTTTAFFSAFLSGKEELLKVVESVVRNPDTNTLQGLLQTINVVVVVNSLDGQQDSIALDPSLVETVIQLGSNHEDVTLRKLASTVAKWWRQYTSGATRAPAKQILSLNSLLAMADEEDPKSRRKALVLIAEFNDDKVNHLMLRCLNDPDDKVRRLALKRLEELELPEALGPLKEFVRTASIQHEKEMALFALWKLAMKGVRAPRPDSQHRPSS